MTGANVLSIVNETAMEEPKPSPTVGGVDARKLRSIVEQIARLEDERQERADDIKELKAGAKSAGFVVKSVMKQVKKARETSDQRAAREQLETADALYDRALGDFADMPLAVASKPSAR